MQALVAVLVLCAAAVAQDEPLAARFKSEQTRLADLQRRFSREPEGTNEKKRLQLELRVQRARVKELGETLRAQEEKARRRIEELDARIKENPNDAEAHAARGVSRRQRGDLDSAERDFARAIELRPALAARLAHLRVAAKAPPKMRPEMERIRAYVEENEPETYHRLLALEKQGRRADLSRMLRDAETRMKQLGRLRERNPEAYGRMMAMRDLEREALGLAARASGANPEERVVLLGQLTGVLGRLFDLREEFRTEELKVLRGRIEALTHALDGRRGRKADIIERRKRELLDLIK